MNNRIKSFLTIGIILAFALGLLSGCDSQQDINEEMHDSEIVSEGKQKHIEEGSDHNPVFTQYGEADPFALVIGGRVYIYSVGSDVNTISIISSGDMVNWTDHGSIQVTGPNGMVSWGNKVCGPTVCAKIIDDKIKYFLYFSLDEQSIGVLTADSPTGPFTSPSNQPIISRSTGDCIYIPMLTDPAVTVDDDGTGYLYFGGGVSQNGDILNPGTSYVVKLSDDMTQIAENPVLLENIKGFWKDSEINQINYKYIYSYCVNDNIIPEDCKKYGLEERGIITMCGDSPEGPFEYAGLVMSNPDSSLYQKDRVHHSFFMFKNRCFIVYQTCIINEDTGNFEGCIGVNIDEVLLDEEGLFEKVDRSQEGATQTSSFCPYFETSFATMAGQEGIEIIPGTNGAISENMNVRTGLSDSYIKLAGVNFEEGSSHVKVKVRAASDGTISVKTKNLESDNKGTLEIKASDEFEVYDIALSEQIAGIDDLFFTFDCEGIELDSWQFVKDDEEKKNVTYDGVEDTEMYYGQADLDVDSYAVNVNRVTELFCPNNEIKRRSDVEYGRVESITYFSNSIGCERNASVLLPGNYDKSKEYPVIYFLHGMGGDENYMISIDSYKIKEIVANLNMDGLANEVIMIFPDIYATDDIGLTPGFSTYQLKPYDDFIFDLSEDLIPYVESHYSVSRSCENRGIIGFSMGGRQALYIGITRADLFSYVGAISPAPGLVSANAYDMYFEGQLTEEEIDTAFNDRSPCKIMICSGTMDEAVGVTPRRYHNILLNHQIDHIFYEMPGTDHDSNAVRSGLYNFMIRFQK